MRNAFLAAILALACVAPLCAQEPAAQSLSLDQAIATAIAQNPSYRESLAAVDAGVGRVLAARSSLGPSVTLSDAYQYQDTVAKLPTPFGPLPFSPNSTNVPLLGASYTLFDGGAGAARLAAASASLSSTQASARQARSGLISQTSSAYYDLVAAMQYSAVADQGVEVAQAHVELARQRLRAGQIPRAELLQAQTDLADRRVGAIEAHNGLALNQNRLDAAMDVPLGTVFAPTDGFGGEIPEVDSNALSRRQKPSEATSQPRVSRSRPPNAPSALHAPSTRRASPSRRARVTSSPSLQPVTIPSLRLDSTPSGGSSTTDTRTGALRRHKPPFRKRSWKSSGSRCRPSSRCAKPISPSTPHGNRSRPQSNSSCWPAKTAGWPRFVIAAESAPLWNCATRSCATTRHGRASSTRSDLSWKASYRFGSQRVCCSWLRFASSGKGETSCHQCQS